MSVIRQTERLEASNPADIARAAELLRTGHTVAFPTETVYGLGANALDPGAVEKIFAAKQRPHWDPLIVHIASPDQLPAIASVGFTAQRLIDRFWPGPLTLLLPRTAAIPDTVTAGRELVGVRVPNHAVALSLLRQAGVPIAAPSANTFGHTSPTTAQHVLDDLDGRIDAVLDGGACGVGVESTVAEVSPGRVTVYRPGAVSLEMIDALFGAEVARFYQPPVGIELQQSLPAPGVGLRHYAPRAELILCQIREPELQARAALQPWIDSLHKRAKCLGVMVPNGWQCDGAGLIYPWGPWHELDTLAARLFDGLRVLDQQGADVILCPMPGSGGLGLAIQDRLMKAAK